MSKITKPIRKLLFRPMFRTAAMVFLWERRIDVARWARFAKRIATDPSARASRDDLLAEARIRAAISADPVLRNDRALDDVRSKDGVVVLGAPEQWRHRAHAIALLEPMKGVHAVHVIPNVTDADSFGIDQAQMADGRHVSVA